MKFSNILKKYKRIILFLLENKIFKIDIQIQENTEIITILNILYFIKIEQLMMMKCLTKTAILARMKAIFED